MVTPGTYDTGYAEVMGALYMGSCPQHPQRMVHSVRETRMSGNWIHPDLATKEIKFWEIEDSNCGGHLAAG